MTVHLVRSGCGAALREPMSAPAILAEARELLLALEAGAVFVCARPDGDIRAGPKSAEELYSETRVTSPSCA